MGPEEFQLLDNIRKDIGLVAQAVSAAGANITNLQERVEEVHDAVSGDGQKTGLTDRMTLTEERLADLKGDFQELVGALAEERRNTAAAKNAQETERAAQKRENRRIWLGLLTSLVLLVITTAINIWMHEQGLR